MFRNFFKFTSLIIGIFLLLFLVVPIVQVFYVSFLDVNGDFTLKKFSDFFKNQLFIESLYNSFMLLFSVVLASGFALPLAILHELILEVQLLYKV